MRGSNCDLTGKILVFWINGKVDTHRGSTGYYLPAS